MRKFIRCALANGALAWFCASAMAQTPVVAANQPAAATLEDALSASVASKPLVVKTGDRLSVQLDKWLTEQGHELSWDAHANALGRIRDIEFLEEFHAKGSLVQVLKAVLTPFNFEADVIDMGAKRRVIVRNSSNRY